MRFATEEWPPFFSGALPGNGLTGTLLDAVLQRMGYAARIDYYPWKRAMEFGLHDPRYAGVVAMYSTPEREKLCHFSSALGARQPVLAFLQDQPVSVTTLADLKGMRIGTVAGYSNGEQFDGMIRSGLLKVDEGLNDETNLRKLLVRRYAAIVIEKRMLRYLLAGDRYTPAERARVLIVENIFKERAVHVCFQHTAEGLKRRRAFNAAARDVDLARIERDYWHSLGEAPPQAPRRGSAAVAPALKRRDA
ncbi:transporter substrate-binding domain-containing protein [Janthinobacterium sp.]|uniref:substrate-binding periplasmic protein n=1 Tax=Janthinobacterium sp. TaxID=1871054 RepID=UPI00293D1E90|nr:transporter substrate-binding domain-containing protein [Janthinobacterium sp.]